MIKINLTEEEKFKLAVQLAQHTVKDKAGRKEDNAKRSMSTALRIVDFYHSINSALLMLKNQ